MTESRLKLNADKTEFLIIGTQKQITHFLNSSNFAAYSSIFACFHCKKTIATAPVSSRLDYSNSLFIILPLRILQNYKLFRIAYGCD